jgi:hypothetical protein
VYALISQAICSSESSRRLAWLDQLDDIHVISSRNETPCVGAVNDIPSAIVAAMSAVLVAIAECHTLRRPRRPAAGRTPGVVGRAVGRVVAVVGGEEQQVVVAEFGDERGDEPSRSASKTRVVSLGFSRWP